MLKYTVTILSKEDKAVKAVAERAYAKINLCLDVVGRRDNGYHELDGVMQSVTLCDDLTVSWEEGDSTEVLLEAAGNPDMPTDGRNLAVKAALLFLDAAGRKGRISVNMVKRIPMAGGLAGGSADAGAVLRACNRLLGEPLTMQELCALGVKLGADVPFCTVCGAARTQGVGEMMTSVVPMPDCSIVVAKRGEGVSTPAAFARLDERYAFFTEDREPWDSRLSDLLPALEQGDLEGVCRAVTNIFEPVVIEMRPDVALLRETMLEHGALTARMSGSGPSVFGIFREEGAAEAACSALREMGADAHVCRPMRENF